MFKERRSGFDRRSTADGRRLFGPDSPFEMDPDRRGSNDRRSRPERRAGWVRVSKWSSVPAEEFKKISHG